jgi:xanthine dehydrogenase small subunit
VLREDLACTGTKEGCGEGDCGACTVVLGEADGGGSLPRHQQLHPAGAFGRRHGRLWTVEDLAAADGTLHPAQEAMVQCHGSQCGFCTPGFVMSLFGMYQNHTCKGEPITRALAQEELSGNLCRCTGYRPILDAAQQMAELPPVRVDEALLLANCTNSSPRSGAFGLRLRTSPPHPGRTAGPRRPPPQAQIVAGCTDVGLWVTKMHMQFGQVLDVTRVQELRRIDTTSTTSPSARP